jgi:hypothetical protein
MLHLGTKSSTPEKNILKASRIYRSLPPISHQEVLVTIVIKGTMGPAPMPRPGGSPVASLPSDRNTSEEVSGTDLATVTQVQEEL